MTTLALLWTAWCILHSLLISSTVTGLVHRKGGALRAGYRLLYILFSLASLIPVLWYQFSLDQRLLFSWQGSWRFLQAILLLYALIMVYGGKQVYDTAYFLGLRQWRDYRQNNQPAPLPFTCRGVLRYVRHPWYSGGLAFLWGAGPITDVTLVARIILSIYLVVGTLLEEKKMRIELGNVYKNYCSQVPMLIPWRGKVRVRLGAEGPLCGDQQE